MVTPANANSYVGTLVGESTSREFRLAVTHDALREQDIITVNAELRRPGEDNAEAIRVWAKVVRIERINPLFPIEAGHELAITRTQPHDTVLSLSREMVTAVCQVLGAEPITGSAGGRLDQLRYPAKPASIAYQPSSSDVKRVVLGNLESKRNRAIDLATLSNRPDVAVSVDGHAIVTRHLAILAMTGAGKSWTARRIIEELAARNYPIVIFDPHGDYTGLGDVQALQGHVQRYYASFPIFDEDSDTVSEIVNTLGYELSDTMLLRFDDLFQAGKRFFDATPDEVWARKRRLAEMLGHADLANFSVDRNLWLLSSLAQAAETALREDDDTSKQVLQEWGWRGLSSYSKRDAQTLEAIKKRCSKAAASLSRMERTNRKIAAEGALPIPVDRKQLVAYGQVSVVSLAGYQGDFQATIFKIVADTLFDARIQGELQLPMLLVLEEAHNFAPSQARTVAEQRSVTSTRQIAQEGRKFGVGLILISQRPSRLDETTLSQCNSYIIMRMANPADQNYVRRVIETLGEEEAKLLPDLDVGEALLSGQLINFPVLVKIKEPESKGEREEEDAFVALEKAYREFRTQR